MQRRKVINQSVWLLHYIYIFNAFIEKPYSTLMRRNVVYNAITTSSHVKAHDR